MISVIIPTFKNKSILLRNLQHNKKFLRDLEVIVVNDNPAETLIHDLNSYRKIKLVENKKNLGFGGSINKGVKVSTNPYLLFLNDDVVLFDASFRKAINDFTNNKKLFAVSFAQKEKDGTMVGKNIIMWKDGLIQHSRASDVEKGDNAWAEGGACMIRKDLFELLSGFDSIYSPFYWEDIDISYRAWKAGYTVLFNPDILVGHEHETTIGRHFPKRFVRKIAYRNQLCFIWKNVSDSDLLLEHILRLPYTLAYFLLKDAQFIEGFFEAAKSIRKIFSARKIQKKTYQLTDREIFGKLSYE